MLAVGGKNKLVKVCATQFIWIEQEDIWVFTLYLFSRHLLNFSILSVYRIYQHSRMCTYFKNKYPYIYQDVHAHDFLMVGEYAKKKKWSPSVFTRGSQPWLIVKYVAINILLIIVKNYISLCFLKIRADSILLLSVLTLVEWLKIFFKDFVF